MIHPSKSLPLATRYTRLLGIDHPIVQAPMAGTHAGALAAAVSRAGGLGFLPCAMLSADAIRREVAEIRRATERPFGLNFFCHEKPQADADVIASWLSRLAPYFKEYGIDASAAKVADGRAPFDAALCELVLELRPKAVSFHFGLPAAELLAAVKEAGCVVHCTATTVAEATWLEARGVDVVIAQGWEAGGHRGCFLTTDPDTQLGTLALVPQIVDAVRVPVVAAGGIGDARGIAAVLMLGADAAQLGTAYLHCAESTISPLHRAALADAGSRTTRLTNVLTGRYARGFVNRAMRELEGARDAQPPAFPLAAAALAPLRSAAEARGNDEFSAHWAGQAAALGGSDLGAEELTARLATEAARLLSGAP